MQLYVIKEGNESPAGPFDEETLTEALETGQVSLDDLATCEELEGWVPLRTIIVSEACEADEAAPNAADEPLEVRYLRVRRVKDYEEFGPLDAEGITELLKDRVVSLDDVAMAEGTDEWVPLRSILVIPDHERAELEHSAGRMSGLV